MYVEYPYPGHLGFDDFLSPAGSHTSNYDGKGIKLSLLPSSQYVQLDKTLYLFLKFVLPEFINPVALGKAREKQ